MGSGTAAIIVALIAAVPGGLAFMASRRKDDGDVSLRSDDAAWKHLQETVAALGHDRDKLQADFVLLQHKFQEAVTHGERCDAALEEASRRGDGLQAEVAELRRRLDEGNH